MSGSISLIAGNKSKIFQETVFCINEKLSCYGLPNYKPYYNFEEISKHQNIILPSRDNLPGIDLYLSKKTILHKLKTIAIELEYNPQWTPEKESLFIGEPIYPDLIGEVFDRKQSHFILHFDFCGYYVPIDFDDISVIATRERTSKDEMRNNLDNFGGSSKIRFNYCSDLPNYLPCESNP